MKQPYLIQRCSLRNGSIAESDRKGIDEYFNFDYMGSSEFEWGALPKALKRLREKLEKYSIKKSSINQFEKSIWIYCDENDFDDIEKFINILSKEKYPSIQLKEHVGFYQSMNPDENGYTSGIVMWWDIENDFFFSKGKEPLNLLIKGLLNK